MFSAKKSGPEEREISHRYPVVDAENRRIYHLAVDPFNKRRRQKEVDITSRPPANIRFERKRSSIRPMIRIEIAAMIPETVNIRVAVWGRVHAG